MMKQIENETTIAELKLVGLVVEILASKSGDTILCVYRERKPTAPEVAVDPSADLALTSRASHTPPVCPVCGDNGYCERCCTSRCPSEEGLG